MSPSQPTLQIAHVSGCPLVTRLNWLVEECLAELGVAWAIEQVVAECASPTLLVGGIDVTTGEPITLGVASCRVALPMRSQIIQALISARDA